MQYETIEVNLSNAIALVTLNRPKKANSLNALMWQEIKAALNWCDQTAEVRAVVLNGAGRNFCAGIDLMMLAEIQTSLTSECEARNRETIRALILNLQSCVSSLEHCRKPVIAAIHGACVGGGLDLVLAADFRYASTDASFSVREVAMGLVADVGSLQRLGRVVGEGIAREMTFTAMDMPANDALSVRLVNQVFVSPEECLAAAMRTASVIAAQSPLAVRGSKQVLNYSRDHSVSDGLEYVATWNGGMLLSADIKEAITAQMSGRAAQYLD
ncbi:MAG: hypothetical protein RL571_1804 [Pseudomonadota bacterium]|jgi:enoyl-CoA hydratase